MNVQDKLRDSNLNFTELQRMLAQVSDVTVNWAGSRLVSIEGYEGSLALDDIAKKALDMSRQENFQPQEKVDGLQCEWALQRCYQIADQQWEQSNYVTFSMGYVSRVVFEGYGNSFSFNASSPKWRVLDHEIGANLNLVL